MIFLKCTSGASMRPGGALQRCRSLRERGPHPQSRLQGQVICSPRASGSHCQPSAPPCCPHPNHAGLLGVLSVCACLCVSVCVSLSLCVLVCVCVCDRLRFGPTCQALSLEMGNSNPSGLGIGDQAFLEQPQNHFPKAWSSVSCKASV